MHRMTGGRFALGLGRGFDVLFDVMGLPRVTMAQLEDFVGIMRRLWHGEMVIGHDGPAGPYPYLNQDPSFDEDIPILLAALGERTLEFAGRVADGVVLHTFFTDDTLARSVAAVRRGAEQAGRDPARVRVWSVLATVGDHIDEELRLQASSSAGFATYLQGYGDLLVRVNGWDPAVLDAFRADEVVEAFGGALDAVATPRAARAPRDAAPRRVARGVGDRHRAEQCAARVLDQFDAGADGVILHGATPDELAPVVEAYRAVRPDGFATWPRTPGCPSAGSGRPDPGYPSSAGLSTNSTISTKSMVGVDAVDARDLVAELAR